MPRKQPDYRPWLPPRYELADAGAIQALIRGDADRATQQRAIAFIVEVLGARNEQSYIPDSDRDTAFAEGRRFVGNQIVKLSKLNLAKLARPDEASEQG